MFESIFFFDQFFQPSFALSRRAVILRHLGKTMHHFTWRSYVPCKSRLNVHSLPTPLFFYSMSPLISQFKGGVIFWPNGFLSIGRRHISLQYLQHCDSILAYVQLQYSIITRRLMVTKMLDYHLKLTNTHSHCFRQTGLI